MYFLPKAKKQDPEQRWRLPDRIFFGHGACHILAGVYLKRAPLTGFWAERIIPAEGFWGNHIYATNGILAFDYHGYSLRSRLLRHHCGAWEKHFPGWACSIEDVDFDLLDTTALNARKMLGPDQYLYDAIPRAERFLARIDHPARAAGALARENPADL